MNANTHSQLAGFIWKICSLLRGPYKRNEYRKVHPAADGGGLTRAVDLERGIEFRDGAQSASSASMWLGLSRGACCMKYIMI